jgi:hypothetical protein
MSRLVDIYQKNGTYQIMIACRGGTDDGNEFSRPRLHGSPEGAASQHRPLLACYTTSTPTHISLFQEF